MATENPDEFDKDVPRPWPPRTLLYEKMRQGVLITLNRPERLNGFSSLLIDELYQALRKAENDPEIRAIVLNGAGRAFSAGMDMQSPRGATAWPSGLPEGKSASQTLHDARASFRWELSRIMNIFELSKPVIAAVHGWCIGAATWYVLASHMAVASEDATFGQSEVRMGATHIFLDVLASGYKNAVWYGLTGDHIDAQEALRLGYVNKVVPREELLEECFKRVERIALVPPETVAINLQIVTEGLEIMGLREAMKRWADLSAYPSTREETQKPLDEARERGGLREYLSVRDGPFIPEPFGPRSRQTES